jgi:uncharacterized membrane protein
MNEDRNWRRQASFVALGALLVAATHPGTLRAQESPTIWRGNFIAAAKGLMMSPCRSGERLIVTDDTPRRELDALYKELTRQAGRAIFVELAGQRSGRLVRAERLHRASAEGPGCAEDVDAVVLRANGTEPFWHLDVLRDSVTIRKPGLDSVQRYPTAAFARRGAEYILEASAEHSVLRVTVREAVCRDAMNSGYYTLSASADWDGRRYFGCAYWGDFGRPR